MFIYSDLFITENHINIVDISSMVDKSTENSDKYSKQNNFNNSFINDIPQQNSIFMDELKEKIQKHDSDVSQQNSNYIDELKEKNQSLDNNVHCSSSSEHSLQKEFDSLQIESLPKYNTQSSVKDFIGDSIQVDECYFQAKSNRNFDTAVKTIENYGSSFSSTYNRIATSDINDLKYSKENIYNHVPKEYNTYCNSFDQRIYSTVSGNSTVTYNQTYTRPYDKVEYVYSPIPVTEELLKPHRPAPPSPLCNTGTQPKQSFQQIQRRLNMQGKQVLTLLLVIIC